MRNLTLPSVAIVATAVFSCTSYSKTSYYTGDRYQDSLIKSVDNKLESQGRISVNRYKKQIGQDSLVYYAVEKATNRLVSVGFSEIKDDRRTVYTLMNGELVKVLYKPNHRKGEVANIYFYENGKLVYKRDRNPDSPDSQKFLNDINFFKATFGVL